MPAGSAVGMTVRMDAGGMRKNVPRMASQKVFGEDRGGRTRAAPGVPSRAASRRAGWIRDKARTCREMHEPDAVTAASVRG